MNIIKQGMSKFYRSMLTRLTDNNSRVNNTQTVQNSLRNDFFDSLLGHIIAKHYWINIEMEIHAYSPGIGILQAIRSSSFSPGE
jgi:hypothetical protein